MKLNIRLYYKLLLLILLFTKGLIIAGIIFPTLGFLNSARNAKIKRDALKIRWLRGSALLLTCISSKRVNCRIDAPS